MQFSTQTSTSQDGNSQVTSQTRIPGRHPVQGHSGTRVPWKHWRGYSTGTGLQVQYWAEQSQCQHDMAVGALSPTCCQIKCPSLGRGLEGRKPVQHRAHHRDLSQQPLQGTIQHWLVRRVPRGDKLPQGTTGLMLVASPLPAVVLHLLSEAGAVLPVSLF